MEAYFPHDFENDEETIMPYLSDDVLYAIISRIDRPWDLMVLSTTCKRFHALISQPFVWRNLYWKLFGPPTRTWAMPEYVDKENRQQDIKMRSAISHMIVTHCRARGEASSCEASPMEDLEDVSDMPFLPSTMCLPPSRAKEIVHMPSTERRVSSNIVVNRMRVEESNMVTAPFNDLTTAKGKGKCTASISSLPCSLQGENGEATFNQFEKEEDQEMVNHLEILFGEAVESKLSPSLLPDFPSSRSQPLACRFSSCDFGPSAPIMSPTISMSSSFSSSFSSSLSRSSSFPFSTSMTSSSFPNPLEDMPPHSSSTTYDIWAAFSKNQKQWHHELKKQENSLSSTSVSSSSSSPSEDISEQFPLQLSDEEEQRASAIEEKCERDSLEEPIMSLPSLDDRGVQSAQARLQKRVEGRWRKEVVERCHRMVWKERSVHTFEDEVWNCEWNSRGTMLVASSQDHSIVMYDLVKMKFGVFKDGSGEIELERWKEGNASNVSSSQSHPFRKIRTEFRLQQRWKTHTCRVKVSHCNHKMEPHDASRCQDHYTPRSVQWHPSGNAILVNYGDSRLHVLGLDARTGLMWQGMDISLYTRSYSVWYDCVASFTPDGEHMMIGNGYTTSTLRGDGLKVRTVMKKVPLRRKRAFGELHMENEEDMFRNDEEKVIETINSSMHFPSFSMNGSKMAYICGDFPDHMNQVTVYNDFVLGRCPSSPGLSSFSPSPPPPPLHIIENGYTVGYGFSPDGKYLLTNVRPWSVPRDCRLKKLHRFHAHQESEKDSKFLRIHNEELDITMEEDDPAAGKSRRLRRQVEEETTRERETFYKSRTHVNNEGVNIGQMANWIEMKLWNLQTEELERVYRGPPAVVSSGVSAYMCWPSFSPCGRYIITGGEDGYVWMFDRDHGGLVCKIGGHEPNTLVSMVKWNPKVNVIATVGDDHTIRLFQMAQ